jgi:hypothetical protein
VWLLLHTDFSNMSDLSFGLFEYRSMNNFSFSNINFNV